MAEFFHYFRYNQQPTTHNPQLTDMPDTIRTFIAIELPENIIAHIAKVQDGVKRYGFDASWVRPGNIHLTLKFLGYVHKANIENVTSAMTEAVKSYGPISLLAKGIGVFPGIRRPRVIWIGLKGDTYPLIQLQKSLDHALEAVGFPKEERPFKGHLTLARIKRSIDSQKLVDAMKKFGDAESETFVADKLILFKSDLKPAGAVYTKLFSADLV
jgi:2'-5' RNA ligase